MVSPPRKRASARDVAPEGNLAFHPQPMSAAGRITKSISSTALHRDPRTDDAAAGALLHVAAPEPGGCGAATRHLDVDQQAGGLVKCRPRPRGGGSRPPARIADAQGAQIGAPAAAPAGWCRDEKAVESGQPHWTLADGGQAVVEACLGSRMA